MKFLDLLDRCANLLVTVVRWVCVVLASALFIIVVGAVIARYGFGGVLRWVLPSTGRSQTSTRRSRTLPRWSGMQCYF